MPLLYIYLCKAHIYVIHLHMFGELVSSMHVKALFCSEGRSNYIRINTFSHSLTPESNFNASASL